MESFVYEALPGRVVFGSGARSNAAEEMRVLGCGRALVLSTPGQGGQAESLRSELGGLGVGVFAEAAMHTPVEVTERAVAAADAYGADCVVALGGGSTIGLGKAVALRRGLPQLVIPTTYAGSEMTPVVGETADGQKATQRTRAVLPDTVLYDVDLTLSLPPELSTASGMNAVAHAVEALYARDRNPITSLLAEEAIGAFGRALPRIVQRPDDGDARGQALYGSWLAGCCLAAVGMALHHKLCHVLGGSFDLPHAQTHTVVLPHAVAYNASAVPEAMGRLARALDVDEAAGGLYDLADRLGVPRGLGELGMPASGIDEAVDLAVRNSYWNPRPLERGPLRTLLARAWAGEEPVTP